MYKEKEVKRVVLNAKTYLYLRQLFIFRHIYAMRQTTALSDAKYTSQL